MRPSTLLDLHRADIRVTVKNNHAKNPRVFGSVSCHQDREDSDLDLLVDPTPKTTLLDLSKMQNQLQKMLGIPVDVVTPKGLPIAFRAHILSEAIPV